MPSRHNSASLARSASLVMPDIEQGNIFNTQILRFSPEPVQEEANSSAKSPIQSCSVSQDEQRYVPRHSDGGTPNVVGNANPSIVVQVAPDPNLNADASAPVDNTLTNGNISGDRTHKSNEQQKTNIRDEWVTVMEAMAKHDLHMVQSGKEGIDSLLVFAGLFSAVLTAFNVVAFGFLRADPIDSTPVILAQISQQLADLSVNSGSIRSMKPAYVASSRPPNRVSTSIVAVNALWFSSLVLSLTSASIGILVKQWLQEYAASTSSQVYESICIRQHRVDGYRRWRVSVFIKLLPFLLQLSLLLFFIGLVILIWTESKVVAGIVGGLVLLWFVCWFTTIVLPTIDGTCPYKSAEAWAFFALIQLIKPGLLCIHGYVQFYLRHFASIWLRLSVEARSSRTNWRSTRVNSSWREREMDLIKGRKSKLAWRAVEWTRVSLLDEMMLAVALRAFLKDTENLVDQDLNGVANYVWDQLSRTAGVNSSDLWNWKPENSKVTRALMQVAMDVLKAISICGDTSRHHQGRPQLIVALARYAHCRSEDAQDHDIIQDIRELPLLIDLGGFPLRDEFVSKIDAIKRGHTIHSVYNIQEINELAANYEIIWFNRRKHWTAKDFREFIHVSTQVIQLVIDIPPDVVQKAVQSRRFGAFTSLLQDLGVCVKHGRVQESDLVHGSALGSLRQRVHDLANAQPSLWTSVKDCITVFLNLYTRKGNDPSKRALASELQCGSDWFALAMRHEDRMGGMRQPTLAVQLRSTLTQKGVIDGVRFSADGKYVAEVRNKSVRIYSSDDWTVMATISEDDRSMIQCICFSPDNRSIAIGTFFGDIRIWDIETQTIVSTIQDDGISGVFLLQYSGDGRFLLSNTDNQTVQIWNLENRSCVSLSNTDPAYTYNGSCCTALSPDGRIIATGSVDGLVHIWDVDTCTILDQYEGHSGAVISVVFTPDQTKVVSGGYDGTLKVWDVQIVAKGLMIRTDVVMENMTRKNRTFDGHMGAVTVVSISTDGRWIVSGSDHNIHIWDAETGVLQYFLHGHDGPIQSIEFSPTQNLLLTEDRAGLLRIWEYDSIVPSL